MNWITRVLQFIVVISIPILLVIGSIRLVMIPAYLNFEYTRAGFPSDPFGFTTEDRLEYGPVGIDFLVDRKPVTFLQAQRLPNELCATIALDDDNCAMFNANELQHMGDVQNVITIAFGVAIALLISVAIISFYMLRTNQQKALYKAYFLGGLLTISLIVVISVFSLVAWNVFFTLFHQMFFESGTWQFPISDTLIRLYPEQFWFDTAIFIGVLVGIFAIVISLISWRFLRK